MFHSMENSTVQDVPQRGKFNSPGCSTAWKIQKSRMYEVDEKKKITRDPPACIINKLRLYFQLTTSLSGTHELNFAGKPDRFTNTLPCFLSRFRTFSILKTPGGVLSSKRLLGMCRWMGSHFHNCTDYNGVTFSVELLKWGRKFSRFLG